MKEIIRPLLFLFVILFSPSSKYTTKAFPSGAGHCSAGTAISNESHGRFGSGTLKDGNYQLTIQETGDTVSKSLTPGPPYFLSTGVEYTVRLLATDSTNGGFFRGFLFRLRGKQGENVKNAMIISTEDESIGKNHTMCSATVSGVTHSSNVEKDNVAVILKFDDPIRQAVLEMTVVRSNNPAGSNLWHYDSYNLVVNAAATPSKAPSKSVCVDNDEFKFLLNVGREQDCKWLTKNEKNRIDRLTKYCPRAHVKYACAASCLVEYLGEPCECVRDNPTFTFVPSESGVDESCGWLVAVILQVGARQLEYCYTVDKKYPSNVGENCVRSCGFCSGSYSGLESSEAPSVSPTATLPSTTMSINPTGTVEMTAQPSVHNTELPSKYPSWNPTVHVSNIPSNDSGLESSEAPSVSPTATLPSTTTSVNPTGTVEMTAQPSVHNTELPSKYPSWNPTVHVSNIPSNDSGLESSEAPSVSPTATLPSTTMSVNPTGTVEMTAQPSVHNTELPSKYPSWNPTVHVSNIPSNAPTMYTNKLPSNSPSISSQPSVHPSVACADDPTFQFELVNGNFQDCAWLMSNSDKSVISIESYCSRPHIRYACPATCLELQGEPCECMADNQDYTFELKNVKVADNERKCEWLIRNSGRMSKRRKRYCFIEDGNIVSNVGENCVTSCGFCKGAFPQNDVKPWVQLGTDIDGEAYYDEFGASVSISGDGMTVAVGAPFNDANVSDSGKVRILKWDAAANDWSQLGEDIKGQSVGDISGRSVSLSKDGRTVAIGAPNNDLGSFTRGRVRVFVCNNELTAWRQLGDDIDGENASDVSGSSVSLSDDGRTVAVGAPSNDGGGVQRGHVRVFQFDASSATWKQLGSDIDGEGNADRSGWSVSLSGDSRSVAIGAPTHDGNTINDKGHVRVFRWNIDEKMWQQVGADIDGESYYDESGSSVSLSDDGRIVAVGSPFNNGGDYYNGSVRVFKLDETTNDWIKLGPDINGESYYELSGWSVSLSGNGQVVAIGAPFNKDVNYYYQGRVRVFRWSEKKGVWKQMGGDIDGEGYYDQSGSSVSLSDDGHILAVGAPFNKHPNTIRASGNVRIFRAP